MTNSTQKVWAILTKELGIRKNIERGLINNRALAKYLIKEHNLKASLDSVISAIRRYEMDKSVKDDNEAIKNIFKGCKISTKNNLACITLRRNSNIAKYLAELHRFVDFDKGEVLRIIKGAETLKVILDSDKVDDVMDLFQKQDRISVKKDQVEISVEISIDAEKTKGVVARVVNELLVKNINISEILCCVPEILVIVDQKDMLSAYEGLVELARG